MPTPQEINIRLLAPEDIPFAVDQTDREGWGNTADDFQRYLTLYSSGCFIAESDSRPVGMITSADFGTLAFLGNLIVLPEYRGYGIGERLMRHAIDNYKSTSCRTIELDGDYPAVNLYRRFGFKDKYLSLRFYRNADPEKTVPDPIGDSNISPALKIDRELTGLNRSEYLRSMIAANPGMLYSDKSGEGFGLIKNLNLDFRELGPVIATGPKSANEIIIALTENFSERPIKAGIPEDNRESVAIFRSLGYHYYTPPSLRMYLGERLDYERNIYTIISGDVG